MSVDAVVASVAYRQYGLITWDQALAVGLTPHQIRARVEAGRWQRVHRGVYRIAGAPSSREQRLMAACLACGPGSVVSHRAAGELWGMSSVEPGWVEVTVRTSHWPRHDGITIHRTKDLLPRHSTTRAGLPVTNPMRTVVDLGAVCPASLVEAAMDDVLGRKLVGVSGLVQIWRDVARPGRNGSGVLRALLDTHLPNPGGSRLEKLMLRLHREHGLPEPEVEYEIRDDAGRFVGRVDFAHVADRVVIEVDGYEKRTSLESFRGDRARDRALKALGWTVIRFVWFEVVHAPREVAHEIVGFLPVSAARYRG